MDMGIEAVKYWGVIDKAVELTAFPAGIAIIRQRCEKVLVIEAADELRIELSGIGGWFRRNLCQCSTISVLHDISVFFFIVYLLSGKDSFGSHCHNSCRVSGEPRI